MKKLLFLLTAMIFFSAVYAQKPEEIEAFQYLNKVRQNPSKYSSEIGTNLSYVTARHELRWNKKLYKAATYKAKDMASRGYMSHTDPEGYGMNYYINKYGFTLQSNWYENKGTNYFESLYRGGGLGKDVIKTLIYDGNPSDVDQAGHRKHILGVTDFWSDCYDCAIAFAQGSGGNYWCVLVAKHHHNQKPDEDLIESDIVYFDGDNNDYSDYESDDDDDDYYDDDDDDDYYDDDDDDDDWYDDDDDDDDWYDDDDDDDDDWYDDDDDDDDYYDDDDDDDDDWYDDDDDDDEHHHHHNPHHRPSHHNNHHNHHNNNHHNNHHHHPSHH